MKCKLKGNWCELPDHITHFFLKKSMIYISTIDRANYPYIQSSIFVNETEKCSILFLVKKTSRIIRNLKYNPLLTLTIDETHPTDPLQNEGIMIEAKTHLLTSQEEVQKSYDSLQEKYGINITTKILGVEEIKNQISIRAIPSKIVHWKGPFFKRFKCGKK